MLRVCSFLIKNIFISNSVHEKINTFRRWMICYKVTVPRDCPFFFLIFLPHVNKWFKHKSTCAGEFYSVVKCKLKVKEISTSWSLTTLLRNFNIPGWNRSLTEFVHLSVSLKAATVTLCTCLSLKDDNGPYFVLVCPLKMTMVTLYTCFTFKRWQRSFFVGTC